MAELYQKQKDHPKAVAEYLMAAEIYSRNNLFPQAMAIYKQVLKQNHGLDQVHFKIADIYRQMGFLGDAFYRYNLLLQRYNIHGNKEKAMEVMGLMAELDPRKFTLGETPPQARTIADLPKPNMDERKKIEIAVGKDLGEEKRGAFYNLGEALEAGSAIELKGDNEISMESGFGFKEILAELKETAGPSKAYPNFNFHMGVACREMGFIDEAIEQFQVALEKRQNPFESAQSLSWCYKEKGWWEEARQTLEKALLLEEMTEEKTAQIKKDLDLIAKEIEREKEILGRYNILPLDSPSGRSNKKTTNRGSDSSFDIQDALSP
jgi:tetratricopeptide (TPR) repeat protein